MSTTNFASHRLVGFTEGQQTDILAVLQTLGIKQLLPLGVAGRIEEVKDGPMQEVLLERGVTTNDRVHVDTRSFQRFLSGLDQAAKDAGTDSIAWLLPAIGSFSALGVAEMMRRRAGRGDVIVVVDRLAGNLHLCGDGMAETIIPTKANLHLKLLNKLNLLDQKKYRPFPPFDAITLERIRATPAMVRAIAAGGQLAPHEFLARAGFSLTEFIANVSSHNSLYRKRALDEFTDWIEYKRESPDRPLEKQKPYALAAEMLNELWAARPIAAAVGWSGERRANPPRFDELVMCWGKAIIDQLDPNKTNVVETWAGLQLRGRDKKSDFSSDFAVVTRQGTFVTFDASAWLGDAADIRSRMAERGKVLGGMGRHILVLPLFDSVVKAPDASRILLNLPWICRDLGIEWCTISEQDSTVYVRRVDDRIERCNGYDDGALECRPFRSVVEEIARG